MSTLLSRSNGTANSALTRRDGAQGDPLPVLLLRRGPVPMRQLGALIDDPRLELFVTEELTPEWVSFAQRVAVAIVATEGDPLSAFGYAVTAGMSAPIIMVMAHKHKVECSDLVAAGATACITMPVTKPDLDRVMPLLRRHVASSRIDPTLRLLLDPIARVVRHHDSSVRLSQREFAVLHCLSSKCGRPVAAESLLTSVWGDAPFADRSRQILDVYIFQLRKKLEQIGLKGAISTVRGFGYALVHVSGNESTL